MQQYILKHWKLSIVIIRGSGTVISTQKKKKNHRDGSKFFIGKLLLGANGTTAHGNGAHFCSVGHLSMWSERTYNSTESQCNIQVTTLYPPQVSQGSLPPKFPWTPEHNGCENEQFMASCMIVMIYLNPLLYMFWVWFTWHRRFDGCIKLCLH